MRHALDAVEAARRPVNPHLRYADSAANGYGLASFDGSEAKITLVTIDRCWSDHIAEMQAVRDEVHLVQLG